MNWGLRITILYVAFVALIGTLVFMTMREKVDLVTPDYYKEELKYQQQLDRMNASNSLGEHPRVLANQKTVTLVFPPEVKGQAISGSVNFYRPSDSSKDFTETIAADSSGQQQISSAKFLKGAYQAKLTWVADGKNYYDEISLYVP